MNITRKVVLLNFLTVVKSISDKSYQERIWVKGLGPEVADFDDTVCEFYSRVDRILNDSRNFGLSESQYQNLLKFKTDFEIFCDGPAMDHYMPYDLPNLPEWDIIVARTQNIIDTFKIDEISPRMNLEF